MDGNAYSSSNQSIDQSSEKRSALEESRKWLSFDEMGQHTCARRVPDGPSQSQHTLCALTGDSSFQGEP